MDLVINVRDACDLVALRDITTVLYALRVLE